MPGLANSPLATGPHELIRDGATLVAGAQDVLDAVYGAAAPRVQRPRHANLEWPLARLREAIADGEEGEAAFRRAGLDVDAGLAALAALELRGLVRRGPGGRYGAVP